MLEFFVIFSKSGLVLFATVNQSLETVINGLVKHVFLEERTGQYQTDQLQIKYLMDNEFELLYVVGYQKFLQLCYVDKFLDKMKLAFRDKYSDFDLRRILNISFNKQTSKLIEYKRKPLADMFNDSKNADRLVKKQKRLDFCDLIIDEGVNVIDLTVEFSNIYATCVKNDSFKKNDDNAMRTFQDSAKSKKTIASMIVQGDQKQEQKQESTKTQSKPQVAAAINNVASSGKPIIDNVVKPGPKPVVINDENGPVARPMMARMGSNKIAAKKAKKQSTNEPQKKGKAARQWDLSGSNPDEFDFSKKPVTTSETIDENVNTSSINKNVESAMKYEDMQTNLEMSDNETSDEEDEEFDEEDENIDLDDEAQDAKLASKASKTSYFGSIWKKVSYNKVLTDEDLAPILDQLREHLVRKNVAAQIAEEICENIGQKLKGLNVNSWINLKKFARDALEEAILRILNPSKNINILREVQSKTNTPYVIVLCGVNGVGKSTNLAKIVNWLVINKVKVLVVAGDTFRAGAIEQLRTHVRALKAIHERPKGSAVKVELFEKGYNRDTDNIAREAINYARSGGFNCVIVDTAGRMQDNEPLMKQLAKLIKNNSPDLTLFVGEALVGNEAVDQLTKFNNSLIDNGCQLSDSNRSAINGIVLTKFDTIDDQVGAAISMTYVTGKPIVFVGVGQTYRDLKQLDAKAVTKALMR